MFCKVLSICVLVLAIVLSLLLAGVFDSPPEPPEYGDGWWGKGPRPTTLPSDVITSFKVEFDNSALNDLQSRIKNTRFGEGLENSRSHYGIRPEYMKKVANYWLSSYNWTKQQEEINTFDHFKTNIEGLDIHFMHVKPTLKAGQKAVPLMLIHGWPGSFYEFLEISRMLTKSTDGSDEDVVFEVICPSIPGFTFSEGSHKMGLDAVVVARIFDKLMKRIGFNQYYIQGGDFGATVIVKMALIAPNSILGLHSNMAVPFVSFQLLRFVIGSYFPSLVLSSKEHQEMVFPAGYLLKELIKETGYSHIQATKPDTIGHALDDSPVGLAAYMLEKFTTITKHKDDRNKDDCGIEGKFDLDDLLTNIMLYWMTGSMTTAMRFYKENMPKVFQDPMYEFNVPSAVAVFPDELLRPPEPWLHGQYVDLVQYTIMPRGGHFAALEVPGLLAEDLKKFVKAINKRKHV